MNPITSAQTVLNFCMSLLLFVSFLSKIIYVSGFKQAVADFDIIKGRMAIAAVAYLVLLSELVLASMLALQHFLVIVYLSNLCMITGFTLALWIAKRKRKVMNCHCFGASSKTTSYNWAFLRNSAIILFSAIGMAVSFGGNQIGDGLYERIFVLVSLAILYLLAKEMTTR